MGAQGTKGERRIITLRPDIAEFIRLKHLRLSKLVDDALREILERDYGFQGMYTFEEDPVTGEKRKVSHNWKRLLPHEKEQETVAVQ